MQKSLPIVLRHTTLFVALCIVLCKLLLDGFDNEDLPGSSKRKALDTMMRHGKDRPMSTLNVCPTPD